MSRKYGVVYTPNNLAEFTAQVLIEECKLDGLEPISILDPACGECALLNATRTVLGGSKRYYGIDVDKDISKLEGVDAYCININDAILPKRTTKKTRDYWNNKLGKIDAVIANPPWSSEKIYSRDELRRAGFTFIDGQYDSYVLFIELVYNIISDGGLFAFIIPDSLFDSQNMKLRKFLLENTEIKVIARLGEKLFEGVNRATSIIVCKKNQPSETTVTKCFRLTTQERKNVINGFSSLYSLYSCNRHIVEQKRFYENCGYLFDIDTKYSDEKLIKKITSNIIDWNLNFSFGRGVEISKTGNIVICPLCNNAQGYKKSQFELGEKECLNCQKKIAVNTSTIGVLVSPRRINKSVPVFVGEDVRRYSVSGKHYIKTGIKGINYKDEQLYISPKILVRKTGLGIYATIDYSNTMTSQTVYILKAVDDSIPLEYVLALLNSRVVYYFYIKTYGENEWKSHPYLTKQIIYSLPIKEYVANDIDLKIIELSRKLIEKYDYKIDIELEELIFEKYGLDSNEITMIKKEMNSLPDLSAINDMKYKE